MFVRLLVVLISYVLCCFSVLVCCRSLVQIEVQMGEIEQKMGVGPCQCDRAHCDQTHEPQSSASHVSRNPRVALASIASTLMPWDVRAVICD
jgi:hypothetical protein